MKKKMLCVVVALASIVGSGALLAQQQYARWTGVRESVQLVGGGTGWNCEFIYSEQNSEQQAAKLQMLESLQLELDNYRAETERFRKQRAEADAMEVLSGYGGFAGLAQRRAKVDQRNNIADTIRNDSMAQMQASVERMKQSIAADSRNANARVQKFWRAFKEVCPSTVPI